MMKKFLYVFVLLFSVSCNHGKTNAALNNANAADKISESNKIFGLWTLCSKASGGQLIQGNTLQTVTFKSDGMGYVSNNASVSNIFHWKLEKSGIKIIYDKAEANNTFPDTNYYAGFYKEKNMLTLMVRHNEETFYLVK